jgi:hypothetical protein
MYKLKIYYTSILHVGCEISGLLATQIFFKNAKKKNEGL